MSRLAAKIGVGLCLWVFATGCLSFQPAPLPGEPEQASYMELSQARVRYLDRGKGSPVVFLHGFGSSIEAWAEVLPKIRKKHRVIALDLKGFGWSGRPEGDYSPEAQAKLVFELLDELGVDETAVVAHSWGSSVALKMALMQSDRIRRLALYGSWVYAAQLPSSFYWARAKGIGEAMYGLFYDQLPNEKLAAAFYDRSELTQEYVDYVKKLLGRPGTTAAALAAVRGQHYETLQKKYSTIEQPTLLLWGREDNVAHLRYGERLVRDLPNAELKVYPRCGHFPMKEATESSTRDLAAFLNSEEGR
ncbi:MAG: alpha/beta fold hydrolase [Bradymonadaceae bacterium]